jgi:hypothetical protein
MMIMMISMEFGLLMNALVCIAIVISVLAFSYMQNKKKDKSNKITLPSQNALILFWFLVGIYYLFEGILMALASSGLSALDVYVYLISEILLVLIPLPLAYYIMYILTGNRQHSLAVSLVFALFGMIYLILLKDQGISGPLVSDWSIIYSLKSNFAIITYVSGLFIVPTSMIMGLMLLILLGKISNPKKSRIVFNLFSISFVFDFILMNSITQSGEMQLASRIFVFLGSVLSYLAFFQPEILDIRPLPNFEPYCGGVDEPEQV